MFRSVCNVWRTALHTACRGGSHLCLAPGGRTRPVQCVRQVLLVVSQVVWMRVTRSASVCAFHLSCPLDLSVHFHFPFALATGACRASDWTTLPTVLPDPTCTGASSPENVSLASALGATVPNNCSLIGCGNGVCEYLLPQVRRGAHCPPLATLHCLQVARCVVARCRSCRCKLWLLLLLLLFLLI